MTKIIVKDNSGNEVTSFEANTEDVISEQANANDAGIPIACGTGACRICVAKVLKGKEFIDDENFGEKYVPLDDDEILTCVCGVKKNNPDNAVIEIQCENI